MRSSSIVEAGRERVALGEARHAKNGSGLGVHQ